MKESKTVTIAQILLEFKQEKREKLVTFVNECMKSICCKDVNWQGFEVYEPSKEKMIGLLQNEAIEYLEAIADEMKLKQYDKVKISIVHSKNKTIQTVGLNNHTLLAIISATKKELDNENK